jgi:hypothetical protein
MFGGHGCHSSFEATKFSTAMSKEPAKSAESYPLGPEAGDC